MTPNSAPQANSRAHWLRLYAAVAALPLALVACGGGGGSSPTPSPSPTPTPSPSPSPTPTPSPSPTPAASLSVSPSATSTTPNGAAITLTATVTNSTDTPAWTLTGAGTLSAATGTSVTYTPPDSEVFNSTSTVTISASIADVTTPQTVSIALTATAVAGQNWANATTTSIGTLQSVDYLNGRYVAVSDSGKALTSTDGSTWAATTVLSSSTSTDVLDAQSVSHFNSVLVAAGSLTGASTTSAFATSTDGVTWTPLVVPVVTGPVHALVDGPKLLALSDGGKVYGSTDGSTWAAQATLSGPGTLNAGVYGNSRYVLVGNSGYISTSTTGTTWGSGQVIKDSSGNFVNLHGVTWTGTLYVAVGDGGTIATSPNGSSWSSATSVLTGALRSVAVSTTGEIVVVGDSGIETSKDGVTFYKRDATGTAALYGVGFVNGQFVAVGANSAIKTSSN